MKNTIFVRVAAIVLISLSLIYQSDSAEENRRDPIILVGAGDIADCRSQPPEKSNAFRTAQLVKNILREADSSGATAYVFTVGDNSYPTGPQIDPSINRCYEDTWGSFKARTLPVVGNHDRAQSSRFWSIGALNYNEPTTLYKYFNDRFADDRSGLRDVPRLADGKTPAGYYRQDLEGSPWRLLMIDSSFFDSERKVFLPWPYFYLKNYVQRYRDQLNWVNAQLADTNKCVIAMWHHPVCRGCIDREGELKRKTHMERLWKALAQRASIVLTAHDHWYQRFKPMDGNLNPSNDGLLEIQVGTGGAELHEPRSRPGESPLKEFGVLRLTLSRSREGNNNYDFFPADSSNFNKGKDSGTFTCRK